MQIPKAPKKQSSCQCLFALLGSVSAKAALKMLVKLTQAVLMPWDFYRESYFNIFYL